MQNSPETSLGMALSTASLLTTLLRRWLPGLVMAGVILLLLTKVTACVGIAFWLAEAEPLVWGIIGLLSVLVVTLLAVLLGIVFSLAMLEIERGNSTSPTAGNENESGVE